MTSQITFLDEETLMQVLHTQACRTGTQFIYFSKPRNMKDAVPSAYVAWFVDPQVTEHGLNSPMFNDSPNPTWASTFRFYQFAIDDFSPEGFEFSDKDIETGLKVLAHDYTYAESSIGTSTRFAIDEALEKMGIIIPPDQHLYYKGNRLSLKDATISLVGKGTQEPALQVAAADGKSLTVALASAEDKHVKEFELGVMKKFIIYIRAVSV